MKAVVVGLGEALVERCFFQGHYKYGYVGYDYLVEYDYERDVWNIVCSYQKRPSGDRSPGRAARKGN